MAGIRHGQPIGAQPKDDDVSEAEVRQVTARRRERSMRVLLVDFRLVNVEKIVELQRKPADEEQGDDEK